MKDTQRNRRRLIRFIAQEVRNEMTKDTGKSIPHFDKQAISLVLKEAQRRSGRRGKLSLRLRELGGVLSNGLLILLMVIFMLLEASIFKYKVRNVFGTKNDGASQVGSQCFIIK